jgi:AraC-like DNA-binding protein
LSFVAGLYDRHTLVGSGGRMAGTQANFSPLGARLLLGQPLDAFANRMVELADVWGSDAERLTSELAELGGWAARFDRLDRFVRNRIAMATKPAAALLGSLDTLLATGGQVRIDVLARRAGWSRRYFGAEMRREFGLGPKTFARVLRLGRAVEVLRAHGEPRLAEVAADCGYYDQAHFSRDFREFTGMTPREFLERRLPDAGGVSA